MNAVRTLIRDLIQRKLWPVALLLVVAVAAVPTLLGSSEDAATPAATDPQAVANGAATTPGADQNSEVTVVTPTTAPGTRKGRVRNPFLQPAGDEDEAAGGAAAGAGAPAGGAATSTPGADTSSGGAGGAVPTPDTTGGSGSSADHPASPGGNPSGGAGSGSGGSQRDDALDVYRVDLRFGQPGGPKVLRDVARLAPLPSADNPFLVFLGVLEDRETLAFLLSSDVTATPDDTCRPAKNNCQTIELKVGDTAYFDVAPEGGEPVQYQMDVLGIDRTEAKTAKAAAGARERKSHAGQELLRFAAHDQNADAFDAYRFRPSRGLLARAKRKATARGAVARERGVTPAGWWGRGTRPQTITRKGEVAVWRTRPRASR